MKNESGASFASILEDAREPIKKVVEHFGIILHWDDWHALADKVKASGVEFAVAPNIIDHEGLGEVGNFFVCDPSGNALEFKSYKDRTKIF